MIIVSQDKEQIVNYDNVETIFLKQKEIWYQGIYGAGYQIAEYSTEERAKEVLQEMINTCTCWENFKYGIAEGIGSPKYEMPEE